MRIYKQIINKSLSAEGIASPRISNTSNQGTVFVSSFYHATYLHTQLLKTLTQFWRHAINRQDGAIAVTCSRLKFFQSTKSSAKNDYTGHAICCDREVSPVIKRSVSRQLLFEADDCGARSSATAAERASHDDDARQTVIKRHSAGRHRLPTNARKHRISGAVSAKSLDVTSPWPHRVTMDSNDSLDNVGANFNDRSVTVCDYTYWIIATGCVIFKVCLSVSKWVSKTSIY